MEKRLDATIVCVKQSMQYALFLSLLKGIAESLNNTFVGTLLAGLILAWVGLSLYRKQKKVDFQYNDLIKTKELAATLFAVIDIADKYHTGQFNTYSGDHPDLKKIVFAFDYKFNNYFKNEIQRQSNDISSKITSAADNLVTQLKIHGEKYDKHVRIITSKITELIIYFYGATVFEKMEQKEIEEIRDKFEETANLMRGSLKELIEIK